MKIGDTVWCELWGGTQQVKITSERSTDIFDIKTSHNSIYPWHKNYLFKTESECKEFYKREILS